MKEQLKEIINHYGVMKQLKYFQSEVFELNEAIINAEYLPFQDKKDINHIAEEIADVEVMLNQFKEYYHIDGNDIMEVMKEKVERQLERIKNEENK